MGLGRALGHVEARGDLEIRQGWERVRYEWREWGKAALAWAIACGVLDLAVLMVGDAARTAELVAWILRLTVVVVIWFVAFPLLGQGLPGEPVFR